MINVGIIIIKGLGSLASQVLFCIFATNLPPDKINGGKLFVKIVIKFINCIFL